MGFMDKLKAMKNAVTGGAATVQLEAEPLTFDGSFGILVRAQTKDAPVKVNRVYVKISAEEEVEVPDHDVIYDSDGDSHRRTETVRARHETVDIELTIADAQELEANQTYEWRAEVTLPSDAPPIFKGRFSQHTYSAFAGLDCFGNDPDSGWVELYP